MTGEYFVDDRHALYVGWVLGAATLAGVQLAPVLDDDGNHTDRLRVLGLVSTMVVVTLVVPYPPDDWSLSS